MREREVLIKACRILAEQRLIRATEGNLSLREEEEVIITPTGVRKAELEVKDLSVIDLDGNHLEGPRPSSEYRLHLEIYKRRPDVNAIVHAHPEFAAALSIAGVSLEFPVLSEAVAYLGPVPNVPHALPSTQDLAVMAAEYTKKYDALLLSNHGAVTVGHDVNFALYLMEILEYTARVFYRALLLGRVHLLTKHEVEKLLEIREKSYHLPPRDWSLEDFKWDLSEIMEKGLL